MDFWLGLIMLGLCLFGIFILVGGLVVFLAAAQGYGSVASETEEPDYPY